MDIEFHYDMTYAIAQRAGFDDERAHKIAYASQQTDDNTVAYDIRNDKDEIVYRNQPSQTMNILKPKAEHAGIYPLFHFVPGDSCAASARRKDGMQHVLNTTPNNDRAKMLLGAALEADDVYQIGIATHCFADTWAHRNFSGNCCGFNAMKGVGQALVPDYGHADAGHRPDIPGLVWEDDRTVEGEIHNKALFLDAAEQLFRAFKRHNDPDCAREEVDAECARLLRDLDAAIGPEFKGKDESSQQRKQRYAGMIGNYQAYDANAWFEGAVDTKVRGLPDWLLGILRDFKILQDDYTWKDGHESSDWFKFEEAVKAHQERAEALCKPLFDQMGIDAKNY